MSTQRYAPAPVDGTSPLNSPIFLVRCRSLLEPFRLPVTIQLFHPKLLVHPVKLLPENPCSPVHLTQSAAPLLIEYPPHKSFVPRIPGNKKLIKLQPLNKLRTSQCITRTIIGTCYLLLPFFEPIASFRLRYVLPAFGKSYRLLPDDFRDSLTTFLGWLEPASNG